MKPLLRCGLCGAKGFRRYLTALLLACRCAMTCRGLAHLLCLIPLCDTSEGYVAPPSQFHPRGGSIGRAERVVACAAAGGYGREKTVVLLYNKAANVITSHSSADLAPEADASGRMTVYQDVVSMDGYVASSTCSTSSNQGGNNKHVFEKVTGIHSKLHAIGRLDADTTGLLLLTNDGGLVHYVTNPNAKISTNHVGVAGDSPSQKLVTKTYEALIMGHHDMESSPALQQILNVGVDLGAKIGRAEPAIDLQVLSHPTAKSTLVEITIASGLNRQVRRTFHAVGSGVMKLKRTRIGNGLELGDLEEGQWRILSDDEVEKCLGWKVRYLDENRDKKPPRRRKSNSRRRRR